jgi:hypothetical protein
VQSGEAPNRGFRYRMKARLRGRGIALVVFANSAALALARTVEQHHRRPQWVEIIDQRARPAGGSGTTVWSNSNIARTRAHQALRSEKSSQRAR